MPQMQSKPAAKPIKRLSGMSLSISKYCSDASRASHIL